MYGHVNSKNNEFLLKNAERKNNCEVEIKDDFSKVYSTFGTDYKLVYIYQSGLNTKLMG